MDTDAVLTLLQETAETVINPRFRALAEGDISSKTHPGDLVTVADREAEVLIARALRAAYPQAMVLGEEEYAGDARLLDAFRAADHAFTVDPVDGTRNFVHGSPDHAVMAAEVAGSVVERDLLDALFTGRAQLTDRLERHMSPPLPTIVANEPLDTAMSAFAAADAALVLVDGKPAGVVTRSDVLAFLGS